jgi:3-oxoacyl-[acyl-carrier protein] reductase
MGKLDSKIALIAGGTGSVGEGIVRAFLKQGATVVIPSRTAERLEQLRGYLGELAKDRFIPVTGDMSETETAERLRDEVLNKVGRLDAVVASLNGRWNENLPLIKVSLADWRRMLDSNLTSHFIAARTFLPVLERGSSYTLIGGGAADYAVPNYDASPISRISGSRSFKCGLISTDCASVNSPVLLVTEKGSKANRMYSESLSQRIVCSLKAGYIKISPRTTYSL